MHSVEYYQEKLFISVISMETTLVIMHNPCNCLLASAGHILCLISRTCQEMQQQPSEENWQMRVVLNRNLTEPLPKLHVSLVSAKLSASLIIYLLMLHGCEICSICFAPSTAQRTRWMHHSLNNNNNNIC